MYQHKVHQSIKCTVLQFSAENDIQMWKNTVCCLTVICKQLCWGRARIFLTFSMYQHKVHQSIKCTVLQFSAENDIQMWKNTVCCLTVSYVNSLMQTDLFNNNNFSLFAFVLLLTLGYTHPFVCKGCYFIPQEIHL